MSLGRMPACLLDSLTGSSQTSAHKVLTGLNNTESALTTQPLSKGNLCGHIKCSPRPFHPPKKHKRRFYVLEESKRRIIKTYYEPIKHPIGRLYFNNEKRTKRGAYRLVRSELREPVAARIGQLIFHYLNLERWALGYPTSTGFHYYTIEFISKESGVSLLQTRKVLKLYEKHGYINIVERKEQRPDGTYRSLSSIIKVNPQILYDLDLTDDDILEGRYKQKKEERKIEVAEKVKNFKINERQSKKAAKQALKSIKALLNKSKNGQVLTYDEKKLLEEECPGHDRQHKSEPLYRDYTGISKNRETMKHQDGPNPMGDLLATILSRCKPPPS